MLCYDGKVSICCFTLAGLIAVLPEILLRLELDIPRAYFNKIWLTHLFQYGLLNFPLLLAFRGFTYQVTYILGVIYTMYIITIFIFVTGCCESSFPRVCLWNWHFSIAYSITVMANVWRIYDYTGYLPLLRILEHSMDKSIGCLH